MKRFVYIITEGVLDVIFLTELMRQRYSLSEVTRKTSLPSEAAQWLEQFKWPVGDDISRMAVPAPAFLQNDQFIIGVRNARGIGEISKKIRLDKEAFLRIPWSPSAIAVVLDADNESPLDRFGEFASLLESHAFPRPTSLGSVLTKDAIQTGIFAFPDCVSRGSIEDVILPVGELRFPALFAHASQFVEKWPPDAGEEFAELTVTGRKKAVLSAMASLLKPGKNLNASIHDHEWIPSDSDACAVLKPTLAFFDAFLANA